MAGKRLLDAAKLFDAGRNIARQHVNIRQQQWDTFSGTSSLVKAAKTQTDRVTVTAGAVYELAKRYGEDTVRHDTRPYEETYPPPRGAAVPTSKITNAAEELVSRPEVERNIKVDLKTRVAESTPHEDDGTLSSLRKRELQRQAERQIPSSASGSQSAITDRQGQDTFSIRSETTSPGMSSLPRSKIPKHFVDGQSSDEHVQGKGLNQDVYYKRDEDKAVLLVPDETPHGINMDIFQSSKVASTVGGQSVKSPYAKRKEANREPQQWPPKDRYVPPPVEERPQRVVKPPQEPVEISNAKTTDADAETQNLVSEIAQAAEKHSEADITDAQSQSAPFEMRESRVPSSRFGRLWQYAGLGTSMAFGAVGESFRRVTGGESTGSLLLSEANMERLVKKLSRMRGAALKLGQMMSFQGKHSKMLPPTINAVLQRVQDSADYMPPSQRNQVLVQNLGNDWRDLFSSFDERPFAAASIGQVHKATLASNGREVAVKIQYPGVRSSIDSDLNNLSLLLTASRLLPKGLYLEKTIANARVELGWECDYIREAEACERFAKLLADESDTFAVPTIHKQASGPGVLTADFMHGTGVTKIPDLSQDERDRIGTEILRLCLRELMEWRFMQTDPNWTNFLFNRGSHKLELLDFGASREFPDEFVEPYVKLLIAASKGERDTCRDLSIELGYLTGDESKAMLTAHVNSILTLAEPFVGSSPEVYDFRDQTITDRVRENIGVMVRERLVPPPEETYSLHRKLSGAFLLCARLGSRIRARAMFSNAVKVWERREERV